MLQRDELGYTALHHAAIAGKVEVVSLLLESGEQVDSKGQDGATPLRYFPETAAFRQTNVATGIYFHLENGVFSFQG